MSAKAVDQACVHDQELAAVILNHPAETVTDLLRLRVEGACGIAQPNDNLRRAHFPDAGRGDELLAVMSPVIEMESKPGRKIAASGMDRPGGVRLRRPL